MTSCTCCTRPASTRKSGSFWAPLRLAPNELTSREYLVLKLALDDLKVDFVVNTVHVMYIVLIAVESVKFYISLNFTSVHIYLARPKAFLLNFEIAFNRIRPLNWQ